MNLLQNKFLSGYAVNKINWQDYQNLSWDDQSQLLNCTILHPLNKAQSVKKSYQYAFLKNFVKALEENNAEVHDAIYEQLGLLCQDRDDSANYAFKHYLIPSQKQVVTLKESKTFISEGTTGLCSWQASLALSEWLLKHSEKIANKKILELGAGTGLSGIVAAKCCNAKFVTLSDGSPAVVNLLRENLSLNFDNEDSNIESRLLLWEDVSESDFSEHNLPEVLLGADITYDNSVFPALVGVLDKIFTITGNSCKLFLAATIRNEATFREFLSFLEAKGFSANEETYVRPSDDLVWDESTPIRILSVTR